MASQISRPRMTPALPRPTRGQIVWWVVGGVVAVAAFASAALAAGDAGGSTEGAGIVDLHPVSPVSAVVEPDEDLPLAA